ncbi:Type-1 restriction enzyme EcoKI specificity protein [Methanosarcinales archaeon]|nr:Type-1 restriction enzyme EcoKI specificity protein [Methanosarcinales archaeon]
MIYYSTQLSEAVKENRWAAEFHRPGYKFIAKRPDEWRKIGRCSIFCQYGLSIKMNESGKGIPIYRLNEIEGCFLTESPIKYAPVSSHVSADYELESRDILFCRTNGNINYVGRTGIFFGVNKAVFASYLVRVRTNPTLLLPEFLTIYLNTAFGRRQIIRRAMPSNQVNVSAAELKRIDILLPPTNSQKEIAQLVQDAYRNRALSLASYAEAQQLLEAELGVDKLKFEKPVGYTVRLSEIETARRSDADFFHVRYEPFLAAARNYRNGWQPLRNLTTQTLPNFDIREQMNDFDYIEIGDVSVTNGAYNPNRINAKKLPANAKIELSGGEILISQVRPTRGAIAIVDDELRHPTICSGAFYVCTATDTSRREIIWLYIRCMKGVFEKYCGGTSYPTIDNRYIAKFPVPLFEDAFANKIQQLVMQSKNAIQKSGRLLEQAKARVEKLIEEAVLS